MNTLSDLSDIVSETPLAKRPILDVVAAMRDEEVAECLAYLADHVGAGTFGEFVTDSNASRIFAGALDAPMRRNVMRHLKRFIEKPTREAWRWDVAQHHVSLFPVERPPDVWRDLEKWAYRNEVLGQLDAPAERAARLADEQARFYLEQVMRGTIGDLARGWRIKYQAAEESGRAMAHGYLLWSVRRRKIAPHRERIWASRPEHPALLKLSHRLKEALRSLGDDSELPVRPTTPLLVSPKSPASSVGFETPTGAQVVRVDFAGFEDLPLRVDSSTNVAEQRVVIEWTLDAIHDPQSPLRPALESLLEKPTWSRLLDGIHDIASASSAPTAAEHRVAYRVSRDGDSTIGGVTVESVLQKRGKSGRWSAGAITPPAKLLEHAGADERDWPALELLVHAENPEAEEWVRSGIYAAALKALAGHPRVTMGRSTERLSIREITPVVALEPTRGGHRIVVRVGDAEVEDYREQELIVAIEDQTVMVATIHPKLAGLLSEVRANRAILPKQANDRALEVLAGLQPEAGLVIPASLRGEAREARSQVVVRLTPEEDGMQIALGVRPVAGGPFWAPAIGPTTAFGFEDETRIFATRDFDAERQASRTLTDSLGLPPGRAHRIDTLERALDLLALLEARDDVAIEWPEGQRAWRVGVTGGLRIQVQRAGDWFGVSGEVDVDGKSVALADLLKAVRAGDRYVRVGKGRFARITADLRARLAAASDSLVVNGDEVQVGLAAAEVIDSLGAVEADDAWREIITRMKEAQTLDPDIPSEFSAELRDYQRSGYTWLARLASWGAGACLADEMGLGKTVQALAALVDRSSEGPALVVAPTSVGQGWASEAARFAPTLDVRMYRGKGREELLEGIGDGTLLVTSYDVLARDADRLSEIEFGTLILDEAQAIKNARTRRAKGARKLNAKWRLALTGTPLENHLGELWSLYRTISPGLLGPWDHFRRHYANPVERHGDEAARQKLASKLRPFLLRRTKSEVARELPPRTEVVMPVELTEEERRLYETAREEAIAGLGGAERFSVLASITRLRRLACHPRLVVPRWTQSSAKLDAFLDLADELIEGGHRALVFSQFTTHLALVREALDYRGIQTMYLDGSTPAASRGDLVDGWQAGDAPFFLISLKAGGTGLNLTAADTVVHMDPWWNPATEDQASDRAHRIGQDKPVTVIRLVSQNTIEERVLALHAKKRGLADAVLAGGETAASLSVDELTSLITN